MTAHRILYVEDDEDIRDTMTMLLEHEGYHVLATPSAEEALVELGRNQYDLLLTDYQLPTENAAWLIQAAKERGCLVNTPVIVLSGAHDPEGIDEYRFLRKPISMEALFAAFDHVMAARVAPAAPAVKDADLRLRLYISGESQTSKKAQRNLTLALRSVDETRVELQIHDVTSGDGAWAAAAEEDRIVVTPTLVRFAPGPKVWIAGDLSNVELVREALALARPAS